MSETVTLFHHGSILPLDHEDDRHQALVVRGDRVLRLGTLDDMRALAGRDAMDVDLEGALVRTVGVTLSRGGPLSQGFLRMHDPYPGPFGEFTRGHTFLSQKVERRVMRYCLDHGLRMNMVLGGYRDHDDFIDTLQSNASVAEVAAADWVLQHCYFTAPRHIEAYADYGFHITTSASFVYGKSRRVADGFPPAVAGDFIAMKPFVDAGLNLACGTDWGPDNPWRQMALNETREDAATGAHHVLPRGNELNRLQSLQAFTRNGAAVMRWPGIGRIAPGALADLVVVDRDPFAVDSMALAETRVLRTIVNGAGVYDTGTLSGGPLALPTPAEELIARAMQA